MDLNSSTDYHDLEQVEVIDDLLEECWFFDNLLNRRSRVLRNLVSQKSLEASARRALTRAPSLPPRIERREGEGEAAKKIGKLTRQLSERLRVHESRPGSNYLQKKEQRVQDKGREGCRRNRESSIRSPTGGSLQRTQTLPSYIGREDVDELQDQESDARLGFLIRKALASSSAFTPPRQNASKVSSIPRHRPPRNSRSEEFPQRHPSHKTLRKTVSHIDTEQIQRLKNPEIGRNKQESDSNSNLRDKKQQDQEQRMIKAKRVEPRAAAGRGQCDAAGPPIPAWVPKDSNRDMKTQIKFWARAVASNVRQEC